jgi:hypothetical protein
MPIATRLNQYIDHVSVLIYCSPQIVLAATNPNEDFVQVPYVASPSLFASCVGGVCSAEFLTPRPDRFLGNFDTALGQEIFDVTKAQREAVVEPYGVGNDFSRISMAGVLAFRLRHQATMPDTRST